MLENKTCLSRLRNLLKKINKPRDCSIITVPFKAPISPQGVKESQGAEVFSFTAKESLCLPDFSFCATVSFRGLHKIWESMTDACHFETVFATSAFLTLVFLNMIGR